MRGQRDGVRIPLFDVDDVLGGEGKFAAKPELVVLSDGVRFVIENPKIPVCRALPNKDPHPLDSDILVGVIHADAENEFGKITA